MITPELPFYIDGTMRSTFRTCPRKFYNSYVLRKVSPHSSIHLHAGKAFAKGCEEVRIAHYLHGEPWEQAIETGEVALYKAWFHNITEEPDSQDTGKTLENMLAMLRAYFEEYDMGGSDVVPMIRDCGKPAVEFSFAIPIPGTQHPVTGEPFLYVGRLDMLAYRGENHNVVWPTDEKTTSQLGPKWGSQWSLRGQFIGYCLTGDHEVLTPQGWKRLDQLDETEKVAQYGDGNITFVQPIAYHKPYYEGSMWQVNGKVSMVGTPEHRQPLWNQWSDRLDTMTLDQVPKGSGNLRFISAGHLQQPSWLPEAFVRLLVAAQADGSYSQGGWRFAFTKKRKIERLRGILQELGWSGKETVQADGRTVFRLKKSSEYADLLTKMLGKNRKFGSWLLSFGTEDLQIFIKELQYWDGTSRGSRGWMYFGTQENCSWVQTIAALTGHYSSVHTQDNTTYRVNITHNCKHSVHLHTWGKREIKETVYCLTVPSSYFLIRHEGKISVTGNCWAMQQYGHIVPGAIVRGCKITKTGQLGFAEVPISIPQHVIDRWLAEMQRDCHNISAAWEADNWAYDFAEGCSAYGGCPYQIVCGAKDPDKWLEVNFVDNLWNPVTGEGTLDDKLRTIHEPTDITAITKELEK